MKPAGDIIPGMTGSTSNAKNAALLRINVNVKCGNEVWRENAGDATLRVPESRHHTNDKATVVNMAGERRLM